jgi:hypothetical protein
MLPCFSNLAEAWVVVAGEWAVVGQAVGAAFMFTSHAQAIGTVAIAGLTTLPRAPRATNALQPRDKSHTPRLLVELLMPASVDSEGSLRPVPMRDSALRPRSPMVDLTRRRRLPRPLRLPSRRLRRRARRRSCRRMVRAETSQTSSAIWANDGVGGPAKAVLGIARHVASHAPSDTDSCRQPFLVVRRALHVACQGHGLRTRIGGPAGGAELHINAAPTGLGRASSGRVVARAAGSGTRV